MSIPHAATPVVVGEEIPIEMNRVSFSRDRQFLILCTSHGLSVVSCRSFKLVCKIETFPEPVLHADIASGTSLIAAVVGEDSCLLQLFNAGTGEEILPTPLSMKSRIVGLKLNQKRVLVLTETSLVILNVKSLQILQVIARADACKIPTCASPLLTLSSTGEHGYAAFVSDSDCGVSLLDSFTLFQSAKNFPHTSALSALELDIAGTLLATASTKGTLIRVFRVPSMEMVAVFRRGRSESPIKSLHLDSFLLSVTGESDTAHIFQLPLHLLQNPSLTEGSTLSSPSVMGAAYQSVLNFFPRQYKDALEAIRDFAFVKLRNEGGFNYFTAVLPGSRMRADVVVVSEQTGFAFVYEANLLKGGECRLKSEYALLSQTLINSFKSEAATSPVMSAKSAPDSADVTLLELPDEGSK